MLIDNEQKIFIEELLWDKLKSERTRIKQLDIEDSFNKEECEKILKQFLICLIILIQILAIV